MNKPDVTVIVPIYKVEEYIERCARSLFEQTLDNLEIIFIDDCSPDNSIEIIKETLKDYPNRQSLTGIIKMSSNSGQAAVRRHGIIEAKANYIIHCDGDDWVDTGLYKSMYEIAVLKDADIVECGFIEEFGTKKVEHFFKHNEESPHEYLKNLYRDYSHLSCCNKLVKRSIYNDNDIQPWPGLNMWEDTGLIARIYYHASRFAYVENHYYHYNRANEHSITRNYGFGMAEQMIGIAKNLTDFFNEKPDAAEYDKTVSAIQYLAKINLITYSFKQYRRFKKIFPKSNKIETLLDTNHFSIKGKIRFQFVKNGMAWLFIILFKIYNIKGRIKS